MPASEQIWTIRTALEWTEGYLGRRGDRNPRTSAQWLLSEATGLPRIELYVNFDRPLSIPERDLLRDYVGRRGNGEPLQYITGEVCFRHIMVKVRPGVLIPRPETEVLVSEALATLPRLKRIRAEEAFSDGNDADGIGVAIEADGDPDPDHAESREVLVADLCTGSGCIACSIAHEYLKARVIATDIASEAIALASENASKLGLEARIEFLECDLGSAIPEELIGSFDLVVSNPPYIPTDVLAGIPFEVTGFEPSLALDGGADGLDIFRSIVSWASAALAPGGSLAVELHETCLEKAASLAESAGFGKARIVCDLAGRDRVLVAEKLSGRRSDELYRE